MQADADHFDFAAMPTAEDQHYEFKSSKCPDKELRNKISCAVSAFANAGGGYFVAGVDSAGNADGGFAKVVGRQDRLDWIDSAIGTVTPVPACERWLIEDPQGRGNLNDNNAVIVVAVGESHLVPHMAIDARYYIRVGAHTEPAGHFLVDALYAKRQQQQPRLGHVFRLRPDSVNAVQLGIVALTKAPAVAVRIMLTPIPPSLRKGAMHFPLIVPVIDQANPFYFDVVEWGLEGARFGDVALRVEYEDLTGRKYDFEIDKLNVLSATMVTQIGRPIAKSLAMIADSAEIIAKFIERRTG